MFQVSANSNLGRKWEGRRGKQSTLVSRCAFHQPEVLADFINIYVDTEGTFRPERYEFCYV